MQRLTLNAAELVARHSTIRKARTMTTCRLALVADDAAI
jgi:hypothetical protein